MRREGKETGRIFKTVRADEHDFWENFVAELVDPEESETRFEKRMEVERFPFTIRLNPTTKQYEIVETKKNPQTKRREKPLYSETEKMSATKHQSVSYANPRSGFKPPVFGWNKDTRKEILVGVSFDPKDCLSWLMMLYDGGTHHRAKDFRTRKKAQAYLDKRIKDGIYCTSLEEIEKAGKANLTQYNEILAGLKWNLDSTSQITVFSNNLESRLLAQLRALDLQKRLEKKYPDKKPITVPISIYPDINDPSSTDFKPYTLADQQGDLIAAQNDAAVSHYVDAIRFIADGTISSENPPDNFVKTLLLLINLAKNHAMDYFSKVNGNKFYLLVSNSTENIVKTMEVVLKVIEKFDAAVLAAGLLEKATAGDFAGKNGFYWLMVALNNVAIRGFAENVAKTTEVVLKVIEKCDAAVLAGLSEKAAVGNAAGTNGFYWLMRALNNAAIEDSAENVAKTTEVVLRVIEKCDATTLAAGLLEKATAGDFAGKNGFYWLMRALNNAAIRGFAENVAKTTEVVLRVSEKLPPATFVDFLKELDTKSRERIYEIVDKSFVVNDLNKLKIALIVKLIAYRESSSVNLTDKNILSRFFMLSDTRVELAAAGKLIEEIIKCNTIVDIRSKIGEQQFENNKLDASRKLLVGKSTYAKCLDDCLSAARDYHAKFEPLVKASYLKR